MKAPICRCGFDGPRRTACAICWPLLKYTLLAVMPVSCGVARGAVRGEFGAIGSSGVHSQTRRWRSRRI